MESLFAGVFLVIGTVVVAVCYLLFRRRAQKHLAEQSCCVACDSPRVLEQDGQLHCQDCGYVGRADRGGQISFAEVNELHGKPLERGMKGVIAGAAVASYDDD